MWKEIFTVKYFVALATLLLGIFLWAGFTGTRMLGDDTEKVEDPSGPGNHNRTGRSGRHYSRGYFYHK